jgi:hypothetical protein
MTTTKVVVWSSPGQDIIMAEPLKRDSKFDHRHKSFLLLIVPLLR